MIDPITAIATATAAFNVIKQGINAGKDMEDMYGTMGKWMGAISDVRQADKMAKNPPAFKKIFFGSSIEEEAMDAFAASKKAEAMEDELRTFVNLTYGPNSWNEILKLQAKIRKDRQDQIYAQQEQMNQIWNWIMIAIGVIAGIGVFALLLYVVVAALK